MALCLGLGFEEESDVRSILCTKIALTSFSLFFFVLPALKWLSFLPMSCCPRGATSSIVSVYND